MLSFPRAFLNFSSLALLTGLDFLFLVAIVPLRVSLCRSLLGQESLRLAPWARESLGLQSPDWGSPFPEPTPRR